MTRRFKIQWIPRASWVNGVDAEDQRWTVTPNIFTGTEEQATLECSDLDAAYDRALTFRAVPLELTIDEQIAQNAPYTCEGCGGDFRAAAGAELACTCKPSVASVSVARAVEVAS